MAERKEVTVDKYLLQENLSVLHAIYHKTIETLHSDLLVKATEAAYRGEKFDPDGIELKIGKCEDCESEDSKDEKSDEPRVEVKEMSKEFLESLLCIVENTVKNEKPSMENLEKLVASLDELFKKKK